MNVKRTNSPFEWPGFLGAGQPLGAEEVNDPVSTALATPFTGKTKLPHPTTDRNPGHQVARNEIDHFQAFVLRHEATRAALKLRCLDNGDSAHVSICASMAQLHKEYPMTKKRVTVRLSATGGRQVKVELEGVGEAGHPKTA